MSQNDIIIGSPDGLLNDICHIIEAARQRVAINVNRELTLMYWSIGERINKEVLQNQRAEYGKAIVSTLSSQLQERYGKDFNLRSIRRMMQFAREFEDFEIVSTLSTQLPWSAFLEVLPVEDALAREFYITMAANERWSVRQLRNQMDAMLYERTLISRKPEDVIKTELSTVRQGGAISPDLVFKIPTDSKLYLKIISKVLDLSGSEHIRLRRSYTREVKDLKLRIRFMNHPKRMKEGRKAVKRIRTIARALVNDISRKMDGWQMTLYGSTLNLYKRVIEQERGDKNKIYSLHEPEVECISKGKEHKKYVFGNKSAIAKTSSGLIVSAIAFHGNPYDGHTIPDHLDQMKRLTGHVPEEVVTDRGYRGKKMYGETRLSIPTSGSPGQSYYLKTKERRKFRNRAGIEPVVGHLKSDHRMSRNYLSGVLGDKINTLMAAAAYNMRHWMNKLPASSVVSSLIRLAKRLENMIFGWKEYRAIQWPVMAMLEK